MLSGYKTYVLAGLALIVSLSRVFAGELTPEAFLQSPDLLLLVNALFAVTIRHGISSTK